MITVIGTIKDDTGQGLPFANVFFSNRKGEILPDNQGTATDEQGNYEITGNGAYVTASYTGFEKQTKPFARNLEFALGGGVELKEVEVIGNRPTPKGNTNSPLKWAAIAMLSVVLVTVIVLQFRAV